MASKPREISRSYGRTPSGNSRRLITIRCLDMAQPASRSSLSKCSFNHLLTGSEERGGLADRCSVPSRRGFKSCPGQRLPTSVWFSVKQVLSAKRRKPEFPSQSSGRLHNPAAWTVEEQWTRAVIRFARFPSVPDRPLQHLSIFRIWHLREPGSSQKVDCALTRSSSPDAVGLISGLAYIWGISDSAAAPAIARSSRGGGAARVFASSST